MDEDYVQAPENVEGESHDIFGLNLKDDQLIRLIDKPLQESIDHWNQWPWQLDKADKENIRYWLGDQMRQPMMSPNGQMMPNMGNRMQVSTRAVLAYVNAKIANPELAPSSGEETSKQFAKDMRMVMHQHSVDHDLEEKAGKATQSLIIQKRGYLKLRFDPMDGQLGDIAVDFVPAEDVVIDKNMGWKDQTGRIWFKQRATVEELIMKFPNKEKAIYAALNIQRGIYSQMSSREVYWETWFTYYEDNKRKEGLAWFLPKGKVVLGKLPNPNFIYEGDEAEQRRVNYFPYPIKPLVPFNYMNLGKSAIDETSLFEQAKVSQDLYNKRRVQIMHNMDNQQGRTVVDGNAVTDQDATKFFTSEGNIRKVLTIKPSQGQNVTGSVYHVQQPTLPGQAFEEMYDYRNEVDQTMGTPNTFRGEESGKNTLGQDQQIIDQAGALQDDLARAVDKAMQTHYRMLFHMMKVYYTEDHYFTIKGEDGKFDFVMMSGDNIDTNAKVSVESGSTLPTNKAEIRQIATEAVNAGKMDSLSYWEALTYGKLPDPETIVERLNKELNDPASFLQDVESQQFNREAAIDIMLITSGKEPPTRDEYGQAYLEYFNKYIMGNKFLAIQAEQPELAEALKVHLAAAGATAARTANLQATQVDDAAASGIEEEQVAEVTE